MGKREGQRPADWGHNCWSFNHRRCPLTRETCACVCHTLAELPTRATRKPTTKVREPRGQPRSYCRAMTEAHAFPVACPEHLLVVAVVALAVADSGAGHTVSIDPIWPSVADIPFDWLTERGITIVADDDGPDDVADQPTPLRRTA